MSLNRSNLINHFTGFRFNGEEVISDEETLNIIKSNFKNALEEKPHDIAIDKQYGIFAVIDTPLNEYKLVTFHYLDFTWFKEEDIMKIMHKARIAEWKNNLSLFKFSESPFRDSGDISGLMRGDFRDCFDAIKEKEEKHQLLHRGSIKIPNEKSDKIRFQCGVGLESLTKVEKCIKGNNTSLGLLYIF